MATGKIKVYFKQKGFGYVTSDEGEDYFFHFSQVRDELMSLLITNHFYDEPVSPRRKRRGSSRLRTSTSTSRREAWDTSCSGSGTESPTRSFAS